MIEVNVVKAEKGRGLARCVERETFTYLELSIPTGGKWMKGVLSYAGRIMPHLNPGQANTSVRRSLSTVEIDNLSGIIAETACDSVLRWQFGDDKVIKPSVRWIRSILSWSRGKRSR